MCSPFIGQTHGSAPTMLLDPSAEIASNDRVFSGLETRNIMTVQPGALSVVIPIHNEMGNIRPLFIEIHQALSPVLAEWEAIFVDDASSDASPQELVALLAEFPQARVIRQQRCQGQSTAVHLGVQCARFPWVAVLDGDGQNDPADIPQLIVAARSYGFPQLLTEQNKPILIMGHRKSRQDVWLRRLSSRVANCVRSYFLQDATPDSGCGLKLFSRTAFLKLPYFDHMHRFVPALFKRLGAVIYSVEVNHRSRQLGISKYGLHNRLWVGLVDLLGVFWLLKRNKQFDWQEIQVNSHD